MIAFMLLRDSRKASETAPQNPISGNNNLRITRPHLRPWMSRCLKITQTSLSFPQIRHANTTSHARKKTVHMLTNLRPLPQAPLLIRATYALSEQLARTSNALGDTLHLHRNSHIKPSRIASSSRTVQMARNALSGTLRCLPAEMAPIAQLRTANLLTLPPYASSTRA